MRAAACWAVRSSPSDMAEEGQARVGMPVCHNSEARSDPKLFYRIFMGSSATKRRARETRSSTVIEICPLCTKRGRHRHFVPKGGNAVTARRGHGAFARAVGNPDPRRRDRSLSSPFALFLRRNASDEKIARVALGATFGVNHNRSNFESIHRAQQRDASHDPLARRVLRS